MSATQPAMTGRRSCLGVLLAAGEGVRMRSSRPKALHEVAGRTMLAHALDALAAAGAESIAVVVGPDRDDVAAEALKRAPGAQIFVQTERRGTAHAVLAAREAIARGYDDVIVTYADTPLVLGDTLAGLREGLAEGAGLVTLGFEAADPTGYGRLLEDEAGLVAIREHKDASPAERAVRRCNAGPVAFAGKPALAMLEAVGCDNTQREFYLTDLVAIARERGLRAEARMASEEEVMGVNDRIQLADAEAAMQRRLRRRAMQGGATLIAPETVFLAMDTRLGRDVLIEQHVVMGKGVIIEDGVVIHAFSHLEGAHVAAGASIGPYARLRPGADIAEKAKVGNFVEIKAASIEAGAKVNHLSYIGDARSRGERQYRRWDNHLQLRRLRQIQDRHRRGSVHRLQFGARRAGEDRRRRLCRLGLCRDQGRRARRARGREGSASGKTGLGQSVPGNEEAPRLGTRPRQPE